MVLQDIKKKTIDDVTERHGKSLHDSEDNIVFKLIKKFPTELSFRKCEERKQRPNIDRQVFVIQVKQEQEPRLRSLMTETKDTSSLNKHLCKTAWTMEMQTSMRDDDNMEVKQKKETVTWLHAAHAAWDMLIFQE